jgi:hypothetical protein
MGTFIFWNKTGWGVKLPTYLHLIPSLIMSGVIPLLPPYAFFVWIGKGKAKVHLRTCHEGSEGSRGIALLVL